MILIETVFFHLFKNIIFLLSYWTSLTHHFFHFSPELNSCLFSILSYTFYNIYFIYQTRHSDSNYRNKYKVIWNFPFFLSIYSCISMSNYERHNSQIVATLYHSDFGPLTSNISALAFTDWYLIIQKNFHNILIQNIKEITLYLCTTTRQYV